MQKTSHTNRLAREKSPYLLQHQHNPVDWYPWGDEAFARARREGKPIFLSIGYSTCHWCHVMERESFEDEATARFMNEHVVSIKVDREERPDVDRLYMAFVQVTTGQGGWPLNVFLTPERKPFFGGTYFPPDNRYGKPSFRDVLRQVQHVWAGQRATIESSAQEIHGKLAAWAASAVTNVLLSPSVLRGATARLKADYDAGNGGFGGAPKFPQPSQLLLLLNYGAAAGDTNATEMVLHTCNRMAAGGIHDQIGGGFARYATDAEWLVPHFEKMLYDNAQLARLYLDAYRASGDARYAAVARDVLDYVRRDMTHPDGGFLSAEDADSEGREGRFYCWTPAEMAAALTPEEFRVASRYFGVTERGNFVDHSDPNPLPGQNVLHVADPRLGPGESEVLVSAKAKLLAVRGRRARPHRDDKVLASWNGLMLGAFAEAYVVLGDEGYLETARRNLAFLKATLWDSSNRTLHHRWRDGERDEAQLLSAYAFLLGGVLDVYEATLDPAALEFATLLADAMIQRFYDREAGGFWQSGAGADDLILRMKEDVDGAEPSGNSVAVLDLLRLAAITDRSDFRACAEATLRFFSARLAETPQAMPYMLLDAGFATGEVRRVVIAGDIASDQGRDLLRAAHRVYQPRKVVMGTEGGVEPFAKTLRPQDGKPTAYVCIGTACRSPTHDPREVETMLKPGAGTSTP